MSIPRKKRNLALLGIVAIFSAMAEEEVFAQQPNDAGNPTELVNGPAAWKQWAEEMRAWREKSDADKEKVLKTYTLVGPYWEIYQQFYEQQDFTATDTGLAKLFGKITDPLAANHYSVAIERLSTLNPEHDPEWARGLVKRWTDERPRSHFAWLVRGHQAFAYAWYWRGSGTSNTVTEEGWKHFQAATEEARECLQKAHAIEPNDPEIAYGMVVYCKVANRPRSEMERYFEQATKIVPSHLRAHAEKVQYLRPMWHGSGPELKEFIDTLEPKAKAQGHPLLLITCRSAKNILKKEWTGFDDGKDTTALQEEWLSIRKAIVDHWPEDVGVRGPYLELLNTLKRYDEAYEQFEWLGNRYPLTMDWGVVMFHNERVERLIARADKLSSQERLNKFAEIVAIVPDSSTAYHLVGVRHANRGEYERAEERFLRALELRPNSDSTYYLLARVYVELDRGDDALAIIQQSKEYELRDVVAAEIAKIEERLLESVNDEFTPLPLP